MTSEVKNMKWGFMALFALLLIAIMSIGVNALVLTGVSPTNASIINTSTVAYIINLTDGNSTTYDCTLRTNENGSAGPDNFVEHETINVNNNSNASFTRNFNLVETSGALYKWDVNCSTTLDPDGYNITNMTSGTNFTIGVNSSNMTFGVDTTSPTITILNNDSPIDQEWLLDGGITIGLEVLDANADTCLLYTNLNGSMNITYHAGAWTIDNTETYTNNTGFNFSSWGPGNNSFADNNTGQYKYNYVCNDTAGNTFGNSSNQTFFVDSVDPLAFIFNWTAFMTDRQATTLNWLDNKTFSTDYTPQLGWNETVELNFSRYEVSFFNDTGLAGANLSSQLNVTTLTTVINNASTLTADNTFYLQVTAYDKSGRGVNMTPTGVDAVNYSTSSICRALASGWNVCGNIGANKNLSYFLNETGATTVASLNLTNSFITHVAGGNDAAYTVEFGEAVLFYMNSSGTWSDSVRNTSVGTTESVLRNESNTAWNLIVVTEVTYSKDLSSVDNGVNGNGTTALSLNASMFVLVNNSASVGSKHIPFVHNVTFNNNTPVKFGDVLWAHIGNGTGSTINGNVSINWSKTEGLSG